MNNNPKSEAQTQGAQPGFAPAHGSAKRGLVCCFCGEGWGYEGEQPTEVLLKEAVDHEAKCPRNPYLSEINRLRAAIEETLADNMHLADGDNCTLIKLKRAMSPNDQAHPQPRAAVVERTKDNQ